MCIQNSKKRNITSILATTVLSIFVLMVLLFCFKDGISGNDFWWHIKVGEYICDNNTIPTNDIFSWYGMEKNIQWTAHEWLADVIFYFIFSLTGEMGMFIFSVVSAMSLIVLSYFQCKEFAKNNYLVSGLFFSLFAVITSLFFYGRPHIFSYFLLFAELKILYDYIENPERKNIFFIPIIGVLWSNLHGGSSNMSYILCVVFLITGALKLDYGRIESVRLERKYLLKLAIITVLTVLSIFINPIGHKVFIYPYMSFADNISMSVINEWHSPDAKEIGNLILYFLPILVMSVGIITEKKKIQLIDLEIMILFLFLFFRSARFIILWYISAIFYAFRYIPKSKLKTIQKKSEIVAICLSIIIFLVPIGISVKDTFKTYKEDSIITEVMTEEEISIVMCDSPSRLFNDYNLGEALIFNNIPVFFDARADLYAQEHIMADGISLMFLEQANKNEKQRYVDIEALIDKYDFDAFLIIKTRPLYSYLISYPNKYHCVFQNENIGYFKPIE